MNTEDLRPFSLCDTRRVTEVSSCLVCSVFESDLRQTVFYCALSVY